jgi:hypothetical protein
VGKFRSQILKVHNWSSKTFLVFTSAIDCRTADMQLRSNISLETTNMRVQIAGKNCNCRMHIFNCWATFF